MMRKFDVSHYSVGKATRRGRHRVQAIFWRQEWRKCRVPANWFDQSLSWKETEGWAESNGNEHGEKSRADNREAGLPVRTGWNDPIRTGSNQDGSNNAKFGWIAFHPGCSVLLLTSCPPSGSALRNPYSSTGRFPFTHLANEGLHA